MIGIIRLKDGNRPAGTRHVDAFESGVILDDIASRCCGQIGDGLMGIQVKNRHHVVALTLKKSAVALRVERHPVIGARILIGCDVHPFYVETVLYHHEAWNGRGYPTGLRGEEIPLSARILTVADVYDVLTSQRPYSTPMSKETARERILLGSSRSFDPTIVRAFLYLLDSQPNFTLPERFCAIPTRPPAGILPHAPVGSSAELAEQLRRLEDGVSILHPEIDVNEASTSTLHFMHRNSFLASI